MTTTHDYANRYIEIEFVAQRWGGRKEDYAETIDTHVFDATATVLALSLDDLHYLTDNSDESDAIGICHFEHDGPFCVRVTESLCDFFGVVGRDDITQAMLNEARATHGVGPDDTSWLSQTLTVSYVATPSLSVEALAAIEETVNGTLERLGLDQMAEVMHTGQRPIAKPSVVERCDSDDAFEIAPPMSAEVAATVSQVHADYGMSKLAERMAFAFDCADGAISCADAATLGTQYTWASDCPTRHDIGEIERLGTTARLCARDRLGWYPIGHERIDWPSLARGWISRRWAVRAWPVIDEGRERVRVAFFPDAGQPEVYEIDFEHAATKVDNHKLCEHCSYSRDHKTVTKSRGSYACRTKCGRGQEG